MQQSAARAIRVTAHGIGKTTVANKLTTPRSSRRGQAQTLLLGRVR